MCLHVMQIRTEEKATALSLELLFVIPGSYADFV